MIVPTSAWLRLAAFGAAFCLLASASAAQEPDVTSGVTLPPVRSEGGDRPHAHRDAAGNFVLRNRHLVAVLNKDPADSSQAEVALFPNPRPGTEIAEPVAIFRLPLGEAVRFQAELKGDRVLLKAYDGGAPSAAPRSGATLSIGKDPWLSWDISFLPGDKARPITVSAGYPGPRETLFPGVVYRQGTERTPTGPFIPPPHRITVPLMAQSQDGTTVALMWAPGAPAGGGYPAALFDSPADGPTRMELNPPATTGSASATGLRFGGKLLVLRDTPDPAEAIRRWTDAYPLPKSPTFPRSFAEERRLSRQAFTRALWSAEAPGWRSAADAPEALPHVFGVQALLMDASLEKGNAAGELRAQAERVLAVLGARGALEPELAYRVGGVPAALDAERDRITDLMASQLPDGGWLPTRAAGSISASLASPRIEAGVVAANALPILRHAALTGDSTAAGAGRRAVDHLYRLRLPASEGRGSIPAGTPELLTAARVAECFLLAYRMNGDREYLRTARYWADTGLGFVYLWSDASRPAMRYATIPTMGLDTDGAPLASQAAGLEYARVLQALHTLRPDDLYKNVAEGILAGAMRQQAASGDAAGLLPEFWNVKDGTPEGRQLNPWPLLDVMYRLIGHDPDVSQARVRVGSDRLFVASGAVIADAATTATRLRLKLRGLPGTSATTTITGVPALPLRVEYNSRSALPFGITTDHRLVSEGAPEASGTWSYSPDIGLLIVRVAHIGDDDHLEIRWPDPRERAPVKPADRAIQPHR